MTFRGHTSTDLDETYGSWIYSISNPTIFEIPPAVISSIHWFLITLKKNREPYTVESTLDHIPNSKSLLIQSTGSYQPGKETTIQEYQNWLLELEDETKTHTIFSPIYKKPGQDPQMDHFVNSIVPNVCYQLAQSIYYDGSNSACREQVKRYCSYYQTFMTEMEQENKYLSEEQKKKAKQKFIWRKGSEEYFVCRQLMENDIISPMRCGKDQDNEDTNISYLSFYHCNINPFKNEDEKKVYAAGLSKPTPTNVNILQPLFQKYPDI